MVTCRCKVRDGPDIDWQELALYWSLPLSSGELRGFWRDARNRSKRREQGAITTLVGAHQRLVRHVANLHVGHGLLPDQAESCLNRLAGACNQALRQAILEYRWRPNRDKVGFILFVSQFFERAIAAALAEEGCCEFQSQSRD